MITQIFDQNCVKILTLFSLSAGSNFNRKFIQEKTKLNNVPLDRSLLVLLSSNIVKREKNYYSFNFENNNTKFFIELISKEFRRLKELPLDVYYTIIDLVNFFSTEKNFDIFLFGSYAKLIFSQNSDIDIAIVYEKEFSKLKIKNYISKLEKIYGKEIEIHYFENKLFYKNKSDSLIKSILKDGVKLI